MEVDVINLGSLDGAFDLQPTLKSGQSYFWDCPDGRTYECDAVHGDDAWYQTVVPPLDGVSDKSAVVRARQTGGALEWESNVDAIPLLTHLSRPDDDLGAIVSEVSDEPLVRWVYEAYPGTWFVRDPPFGCLVSFICSVQTHIPRAFGVQSRLKETYGECAEFDGETYFAYSTPERLAEATEDELRDLSFGYRAPYVRWTAEMVAMGEATPAKARDHDYEDTREFLTTFVGVGNRAADCVLLFSLDYFEAVPFDTWIRSATEEHYPDCDRGNYADTLRVIRERLGGRCAGYTQTYAPHYLRSGGE